MASGVVAGWDSVPVNKSYTRVADAHIGPLVHEGKHPFEKGGMPQIIGIEKSNHIGPCECDAAIARHRNSRIVLAYQGEARISRHEGIHATRGAITRTIINDDGLKGLESLLFQTCQCRGNETLCIEERNDNGDQWFHDTLAFEQQIRRAMTMLMTAAAENAAIWALIDAMRPNGKAAARASRDAPAWAIESLSSSAA